MSATPENSALRAPLPPRNGEIAESVYWYPNELAVTVHAPKPPTLRQLRDLSARLNRLLSRIGVSILPFYSGGHLVSRAGIRESTAGKQSTPSAEKEETMEIAEVEAPEVEVGVTPTAMKVKASLYKRWEKEVQRCGEAERFPGVHPFGEGPKGVAVVFYALRTHHRSPETRRDVVQLAVDLINQNLTLLTPRQDDARLKAGADAPRPLDKLLKGINREDPNEPAHQQPLRVLAAMPNWLTAPLSHGGQPPTGPGAPPIEANPILRGQWEFKAEPFKNLLKKTKNSKEKVSVIVFDTSFANGAQEIKDHAALLPNAQKNHLLKQILADLDTGAMTIDTSMTTISDNFRAGLDEYGRPYGYDMVDHGLFVAGIIRGILPAGQAKIEVIRTQNDYGSGEMDLFLGALYAVSKRPNLDHVVLNLSLGVLPPVEDLQEIWFGSQQCCEGSDVSTLLQTVDLLQLGVRLPIQRLVEEKVVIVAAAGNDSLGKTPAQRPRMPACYDDVLGVAAVDGKGEAAGYSNRANILSWGSGVATFGGEQPNDATETLAMLARKQNAPSAEPDAVEGLYLYKTFPPLSADATSALNPNQEINRYGSAWWSGTSFATPIVSGLAAHYILDGKRGQAVINALLTDLIKANAPYEPRLQAPVLEVVELR